MNRRTFVKTVAGTAAIIATGTAVTEATKQVAVKRPPTFPLQGPHEPHEDFAKRFAEYTQRLKDWEAG